MNTKIIFFILLGIFLSQFVLAQDKIMERSTPAGRLDFKEHGVFASTGIDYAIMPFTSGYKYGLNFMEYEFPFEVGGQISIPLFAFDLSDIRIRGEVLGTILRSDEFELTAALRPLFIQTKLETQRLSSLGTDFYIGGAWFIPKWSFGAEITYNTIFTTHISHTDVFKQNVYADVKDGWYRNTAGNFQFGVSATRRQGDVDIFIKTGYSTTSRFNGYLFVPPFYLHIGACYIW